MKFRIALHAEAEMNRRDIPRMFVEAVLDKPRQIVDEYGNKKAYQSKIDFGKGIIYLLRVSVDDTVTPKSVVTI